MDCRKTINQTIAAAMINILLIRSKYSSIKSSEDLLVGIVLLQELIYNLYFWEPDWIDNLAVFIRVYLVRKQE